MTASNAIFPYFKPFYGIFHKRCVLLCAAAAFFAAGCFIYMFFRGGDYLILRWLGMPAFPGRGGTYKGAAAFFAYNLPDGLWLLSGLAFLRLFWLSAPRMGRIYKAAFCVLALALEFLQIAPQIPGTFDIADVITLVSAAFLEGCLYKILFKEGTLCVSK